MRLTGTELTKMVQELQNEVADLKNRVTKLEAKPKAVEKPKPSK